MLFEQFMTPCTLKFRTEVDDGQGGQTVTYVDVAGFDAAIVKATTFEARIAEKETGRASYQITAYIDLPYHSVFVRKSDGKVFRSTSNTIDSSPPAMASFNFKQVTAEEFEV